GSALAADRLAALEHRRLERRGEPRPLALGRGQRLGEVLDALARAAALLEPGLELGALLRQALDGRAQLLRLVVPCRQLGGEARVLREARGHLGAQVIALLDDPREI